MIKSISTLIPKRYVMLNKYMIWFLEEIIMWIDERSPCSRYYLLGALDKVSHQRLLLKLKVLNQLDFLLV